MMLKTRITIGFAIFTALMIWLALSLARSTPWWLITGALVLAALVVLMVHLRLSFWQGQR